MSDAPVAVLVSYEVDMLSAREEDDLEVDDYYVAETESEVSDTQVWDKGGGMCVCPSSIYADGRRECRGIRGGRG